MSIVLGIISFIIGIAGVVLICLIVRNKSLKERAGRIIVGRKINCKELPGCPTRYIVSVEYEINNTIYTKTVVTADKNISKCAQNEQIKLIYVDKTNKIYWAEDKSPEMMLWIILLVFVCFFAFLHSFRFLMESI